MRGIVGDMLSNGVEQKPAPQTNKVIIRLISIKRYTFRQYQWKIYQYFVRQIPEDIELSDAMRFIETLMKMVDTWDKNTDDALIHALLAPDSSPLHRFRREHRENKQLSSSIFVFLRVIARLCKSNDTMANVARELSKQLGNNVAIMTAAYDVCADTPTLRRMTTVLSVNQVSMADFNVISVQPAHYLLLDMAALCLEIKKTVLLIVLQYICILWHCKCYDAFDAALQILKDFWSRNDPSLIELDELALLGCLLEDMTDVWANVNLRSRQVLCSLTDTILNVFKFENNTKAVTLPLRSIIVGILKATDDERNNDVRESMIRLICRYCQKFDMVDIMDLVLRQAKKGIKDPCLIIQDASMELLSVLNPFMICEARVPPDAVTLLLQRNIMATPHTGSFRPIHYEIVMRHLGMSDHLIGPSAESPQLSTAENVRNPLEWAQRLFHQCDTVRNMKTASILENTEEDRLEVQIANASDGSATNALAAAPRSSVAFFRTNKRTCHEYFARIRPKIIKGASIVRNDHLLIRNAFEILSERESGMKEKVSADTFGWFLETNQYLRELVEVCIRQNMVDHINGLQSWYKRLIRKVNHWNASFQDQWVFNGLNGPFAKADGISPSVSPTWFQIAAMFASGCDEAAIKNLKILRASAPRDDFGFLSILDAQARDFYTCVEDYDSLQFLKDSEPFLFSDLVTQDFITFTSGGVFSNDRQGLILADIREMTDTKPLEPYLHFGRLNQFRCWLSDGSIEMNAEMNEQLARRLLLSLKDDLSTNRPSLLEVQLLRTCPERLIVEAQDWFTFSKLTSVLLNRQPETRLWARMVTTLQNLEASVSGTETIDVAEVHLRAAKIAHKQGNIAIANCWLDKALESKEATYYALYQRAKLYLTQSDYDEAIKVLSDILSRTGPIDRFKKLQSQSYIKVARLLKAASEEDAAALLNRMNLTLIEPKPCDLQSPVESAIDNALTKAVEKAATCGKTWFEYATHQYKQGWHILDELLRNGSSMTIMLWARRGIRTVTKEKKIDQLKLEKGLFGLLQKYSSSVGSAPLKKDKNFVSAVQQLTTFLDESSQTVILEILDTLHKSIIVRFQSCVDSYFKYLSLGEHDDKNGNGSRPRKSTSMVITATLRLLRMLVKYGDALRNSYVKNVECVHIDPWKQIIPQLFARLNHPAEFVQQVIGKLIDRISVEYPREILYDVIVSSTSSKTNHHTKQVLNRIADRMIQKNENLWISTQAMSNELKNITVLWEEKWLNKIASLQFDIMQQFQKLDQEVARLTNMDITDVHRQKIFADIYDGVMRFVIVSIDKLLSATLRGSITTAHEQWFESTYGKQIFFAFKLLQTPESMATYRKGWDYFQQLHRQLTVEIQKVRNLELKRVSPYLTTLAGTSISVPGVFDNDLSCCIASFGSSILVLPTKTKPKKLDLVGTDGKKYSYLLKGLEDLHLDERIMQLLNVTNGLLKEDKVIAAKGLRSRTYAVIPLSDHSGMIQWVNDATPLLSLYKQWQKREHAAHMILTNEKSDDGVPQRLLRRPIEIFMDKVTHTLKSEGLRVTANRRHWPKHVLKKVFLDLVKETPNDLLSKEIWYSSSDASEWLRKSTSFSRSLAVMSILGYIIGLGDRHLDNIMVDYGTGEIIHIDYNVCFEKGKRLRVPELVPYRLSQNIYNALGVTGVDGVFRTAAEETLRVLRRHKEVFITLLDAFVYDPLVDWESETGEIEERQTMELQANLGLIASRLGEKRAQYEQRENAISDTIGTLYNIIQQSNQIGLAPTIPEDEEGSDEENEDSLETGTDANNAKQRTLEANTLPELLDGLQKEACVSIYTEFSTRFKEWSRKRDDVYSQCIGEIKEYDHYLQPMGKKILDQDCCRKYAMQLDSIVQESFSKEKIIEISGLLQQELYCQPLQNIANRAFTFVQGIEQYIVQVQSLLSQSHIFSNGHHQQKQQDRNLLCSKEGSVYFGIKGLLDSLSTLEAAFRRLTSEEFQTYVDESVDGGLELLEEQCYFGCYMQGYTLGLVSLTSQLEEHFAPLHAYLGNEFETVEKDYLKRLAPGACALYRLEDECLSLSFVLCQYMQRDPQCVMELLDLLQNSDCTDCIKTHRSEICKLWDVMQAPFTYLDMIYTSAEAKEFKKKYETNNAQHTEESYRFHWYNAPYIQTRRPFLPNELIIQMSNRYDQLHTIKTELQALNDMSILVTEKLRDIPEWKYVKDKWESTYKGEVDKCTALMEFYGRLQHMENCREGFSQAVILANDIFENLQILGKLYVSETVVDDTNISDAMLHVSSELLGDIRAQLALLSDFLEELKSPMNGIVPLLESVVIAETDADNELRPAQESAKAALRQLSSVENQISMLTDKRLALNNECNWTNLQMALMRVSQRDVINTISKNIHGLFVSLRTLEGFGLDNKSQLDDVTRNTADADISSHDENINDLEDYASLASTYSESEKSGRPIGAQVQIDTASVAPVLPRRNTHVIRIMQRICSKLEGKDFGVQQKMTVSEQVTRTIEHAIAADNLSLMYEGWTSWV
ncbi:Serine/threonine-protein kinase smg1 [Apophysomyces sp. BC1034]|nr:Serine/threonine-protein kinase smg1 [Apophysomyces sp. BC1034]